MSGWVTIWVRVETKQKLDELKGKYKAKSYDEVIQLLLIHEKG